MSPARTDNARTVFRIIPPGIVVSGGPPHPDCRADGGRGVTRFGPGSRIHVTCYTVSEPLARCASLHHPFMASASARPAPPPGVTTPAGVVIALAGRSTGDADGPARAASVGALPSIGYSPWRAIEVPPNPG